MNERIKELIANCTTISRFSYEGQGGGYDAEHFDKEKFVELIVKDCLMLVEKRTNGPYDITMTPETRNAWNTWIEIKEHFGVKDE